MKRPSHVLGPATATAIALAMSISAVSLICAPASAAPQAAAETPPPAADFDWREANAYTLGTQAYIYGYPYITMSHIRWNWVNRPVNPAKMPYAAVNRFWHQRQLLDADYRNGGWPNNDTAYSTAWLNVGQEPVILCHPDMGTRYFTFQLSGLDSDNFDYVGKRETGANAGCFAISTEGWKGKLPTGVKMTAQVRGAWAAVTGRTLVDGAADMPAVIALQDQYRLIPLSWWGKSGAAPESRDVPRPIGATLNAMVEQKTDSNADPLAEWKTLNRALAEVPPRGHDARLLAMFARIGVGPNLDVDKVDEATKRGLIRAAKDGRKIFMGAVLSGATGTFRNGWSFAPSHAGRAFAYGDYLLADQQFFYHDPVEAIYVHTSRDQAGVRLDGSKGKYELRFEKGNFPPANEFWSVTVYDETANLIANPINRLSIGDRTPGLRYDPDGSLIIYIQRDRPEGDKAANWLPLSDGPAMAIIRLYGPRAEALDGRWLPSSLIRTE